MNAPTLKPPPTRLPKFCMLLEEHSFSTIPEGVSPWALLRRTGRRKCPNFSKFSLLFFFSDLGSTWSKKNEENFFFRIGRPFHFRLSAFQTFRLSVKICGKHNSKTITFFDLRPGEEKFCWDSAECPRHIGVDPLRCPPCPLAPKNVFFPPNFQLLIAQKFLNFLK